MPNPRVNSTCDGSGGIGGGSGFDAAAAAARQRQWSSPLSGSKPGDRELLPFATGGQVGPIGEKPTLTWWNGVLLKVWWGLVVHAHELLQTAFGNAVTDGWDNSGLTTGDPPSSKNWREAIETLGTFQEACWGKFKSGGAVKLTGDDLLKAAGTRTLKSSSSIDTVVKLRVRSLLSKPSPEKGAGDRTVVTREEMEALVADEETRQGGDDEAMAPAATAAAAEQAAPAWSKATEHGGLKQPVGDDAFGAGSGGRWMVDDVAAATQAADPAPCERARERRQQTNNVGDGRSGEGVEKTQEQGLKIRPHGQQE